MATLRDYNNTGPENNIQTGISTSAGQTFTTSSTYVITSVKLKLSRDASTDAGTITVDIRTASSGMPTATVLTSASPITQASLTVSAVWYDFPLLTPVILESGTMYGIGIICTNANPAVVRVYRTGNSEYPNGRYCTTSNSGATWSLGGSNIDCLFETYGDDPTYKNLSSVNDCITSETANLTKTGLQVCESNSNIEFNQSGDLLITGGKAILSSNSITFSESAALTILGTQRFEAFQKAIFSEKAELSSIVSSIGWPPRRLIEYNPQDIWGYDHTLHVFRWMNQDKAQDILAISGGRYHNQLVVVGHKSIYYQEI
jgi:hypothetical protein